MILKNCVKPNNLSKKIFEKNPSIKDIIKYIAESKPSLMDNDREFCYIFDKIALNNGYSEQSLPSYWSIGREIFRYKKNYNLKANVKTNQFEIPVEILDLSKYNLKISTIYNKKPSISKIIEAIWYNYNYAFEKDRLLVRIFDSLALNNGFKQEDLPKYWNIIRAAFDYKKDKKYIPNNKNNIPTETSFNKSDSEPIDYRVLNSKIDILELETSMHNKLIKAGIYTISDLLKQLQTGTIDYVDRKRDLIYEALNNFDIEKGHKYYPAIFTIPDIYRKKLSFLFDNEIIQFLSKYNFRNIGLLAKEFPDVIIKDDEAIENPQVFKYINKITEILKNYGIYNLPIKLSKFQIEDLQKFTVEELFEINYVKEIIICINNELDKLKNNEKNIIIKRFGVIDGNIITLEELGQECGVTKERIRQIENGSLLKISYNIRNMLNQTNECINQIFALNNNCIYFKVDNKFLYYENIINELLSRAKASFYIDFNIGLIIKKGVTLEDLLDDDTVTTDLKIKIEKYVYKDFIKINNQRIKNTKNDILIYFLKTHCRKGVKFNNFQNLYMDFLISNGMSDRDDLLYFDNTLYNKLSAMDCMLLSPGKVLRYYDIELAKELVKRLDLSEYKDVEISSRKLYLENLELMQEYEIENEYELHNLLKKHLHNDYISFSRMPMINFGTPNRNNQIEDLLYQLSPIKSRDFALAYEDKYGIDVKNFFANFAKSINKYLINGYFVIHTENLDNEHLATLKKELKEDLYWKEDLEKLYISLFPDGNLKNLNAQNIKLLNYTMTSNCIYSDNFDSLADCIEQIILSNNTFNLNSNNKFRTLAVFYQVYSKLKNNMDIIEFNYGNFINFKKLESVGLKKDDLYEYQNEVLNYIGDKYFTVTALKNAGFKYDKLDRLGFEEYFYSSILINNPLIQYRKIKNIYLMKKGSEPFELSDFLIYIMGNLRKIDIYDLCDYIKKQYNLNINRYKIITITKECNLYYNQITEKVYIDYDEFYNEI